MDWVEGDTLSNYLYQNIGHSSRLSSLPAEFLHVISELERLGIAHGDLSHLNIIVQSERMVLIDYDGMYVPELSGQTSSELGNIHFQHPARTERHYNAQIDRFSEFVIYLSLQGLAFKPMLYREFGGGGEGLLFRSDDFIQPGRSRLLAELENIPQLEDCVRAFRRICLTDVRNIPKLTDILQNRPIEIPVSEMAATRPIQASLFPVLDAKARKALLDNVGEYVIVIGKIRDTKRDYTHLGDPYVFLNFGDWRQQCFTIVLWSDTLSLLDKSGRTPEEYLNRWVAVTGVLSKFVARGLGPRPQIMLSSPTEMEIISERQATERLLAGHQPGVTTPRRQQPTESHYGRPSETPLLPKQLSPTPQPNRLTQLYASTSANSPTRDVQSTMPAVKDNSATQTTPSSVPAPPLGPSSTTKPAQPSLDQSAVIADQINRLYAKDSTQAKSQVEPQDRISSSKPIAGSQTQQSHVSKKTFAVRFYDFWKKIFG